VPAWKSKAAPTPINTGTCRRSMCSAIQRSCLGHPSPTHMMSGSADGAHCVTSLALRRQTNHARTSTTPKPSGDGSGACVYSLPLRLPSVSCWQGSSYCASAGTDDTDPLGAPARAVGR
jgi:hypothetical protein